MEISGGKKLPFEALPPWRVFVTCVAFLPDWHLTRIYDLDFGLKNVDSKV